MEIFTQLPFELQALFAAIRIVLTFGLLFGLVAPLFLSHTRDLPSIEKLIYSWVGLGGVIIFSVFVLTVCNIYDFISVAVTLLLIIVILKIKRSEASSIQSFLQQWELKTLVRQIKVIESEDKSYWSIIKSRFTRAFNIDYREGAQWFLIFSIAIAGGVIRMLPALENAAPFNRGWFEQLNRVKELRLQEYFTEFPSPGGMHSLVSIFSMLTQVSPEMILHLLGSLSSFFLCIIVYWTARDITKNKYPIAPILGMSVYAIVPLLFLPVSLDQQVQANSLDLALCFAVPTFTIFMRNLRSKYKSPWFYVLSGFLATAFINLFVAFIILLPLLFLGLLSLPRRNYFQSFYKVTLYLISLSLLVIVPFLVVGYAEGVEFRTFLMAQLYDIQAYSYFPLLIMPIGELSTLYLYISAGLMAYFIIDYFASGQKFIRDEIAFLLVFAIIAVRYTPLLDIGQLFWIDTDQLSEFYAIMIGIFVSISFSVMLEIFDRLTPISEKTMYGISWVVLIITIPALIFMQGGFRLSRALPSTVPNGFFEAYYQIINERLPYSYATVGPDVQRIQAKNRHFYMDYEYFLDEYGAIDAEYREQLQTETVEDVPPASIFIFAEKAPYGAIQQGILYDSQSVMRDIDQWITEFRELPNRTVKVFYEGPSTIVYEIVNRSTESRVSDILYHIYPDERKNWFNE